jgi:hypothetical protein
VDLKSLYQWSRGQLEKEAERRGISGYRSLTRIELISQLMAQGLTVGQEAVRLAQETLSAALSSAVIRLPRQLEALSNFSRRLPPMAGFSRKQKGASSPRTSGHDPIPPVRVTVNAAVAGAEDANPAHESIPTVRTFSEEPIRTRSMARLLAAQGHRERACAIYEELLQKVPSDAQLRGEAEAVKRGHDTGFDNAERLRRASHAQPITLPDSADVVRCERVADGALVVSWTVTDQGKDRAAAVLGKSGELAVRIMAVIPDTERVVRSEVTEYGPVNSTGSWTSQQLPVGARCFTAVGLRANNRFVAIVHAAAHTIGLVTKSPAPLPAGEAF